MTWKNAAITQHDNHPQPVTGNTNYLYALDWSVDRILAEGMFPRQERFRAAGKRLRRGFAEYGFRLSADPEDASPVVSDFYPPEGFFGEDVRSYFLEKYDIMVGQGFAYRDEQGRSLTFRIAHFGLAAEPDRIETMIRIAGMFVRERK
jgi:aspartate aminotransferase-like enzyme